MLKNRITLHIFLIFIILFLPFWIHNSSDDIVPKEINESNLDYYRSTTCNISLFEVVRENLNNEVKINYYSNNYVRADCFGKVTGLDLINNKYQVSIGTNSLFTFTLQAAVWCLVLSAFIVGNKKKITLSAIVPLSLFFVYQQKSEERFYSDSNIYFNNLLESNNYYLIILFLSIYLIFVFISLKDSYIEERFLNLVPFSFLFIGTFNGFNLNFLVLIISFFGLKNLIYKKNVLVAYNIIYFLLSIIWVFTSSRENNSFFDGDKLRGFINSSNSFNSLIFWVILFFLLLNGFIYLINVSKVNVKTVVKNSVLSSGIVVFFGIVGSISPLFNFYNFLFFGQNKRGIDKLESVAGNTWRGFSASAESIGEFFGFTIVLLLILFFSKKLDFSTYYIPFFLLGIFGLYRANNFAAYISILLTILLYIYVEKIKNRNLKIYLFIGGIFVSLILFSYLVNDLGKEYVSTELLYEATLHSNLYPEDVEYTKTTEITNYFNAGEIYSLLTYEANNQISSSLRFLSNIFYQENLNIPFVPNIVTVLSFISLMINRTEMWGIFIAKYSPNLTESLFGNGPMQLNNYLYKQNVRLDLPEEKLSSLFLPHSSIMDLLIFFGCFGVLIFLFFNLYLYFIKNKNSIYKYLIFFIMLNILKSDSLLYINSVLLLVLVYGLSNINKEIND
tara:strand:+ start:2263 stop:4284 length:2022 start_codon:yes stop_codon:yes gene_type:complete